MDGQGAKVAVELVQAFVQEPEVFGLVASYFDEIVEEVAWESSGVLGEGVRAEASDYVPGEVDGPLLNVGQRVDQGHSTCLL